MRTFLLTSVVVLGAGGLAGCARSPDYAPSAAAVLQQEVAAVTNAAAAAAGKYQAALSKLDNLQALAASDEAKGHLPPQRQAEIDAAINRVRQDLQRAIAASQQAALNQKLNSLAEQQKALLAQQQQQSAAQAAATQRAPHRSPGTGRPEGDGHGRDSVRNDG